MVVMTDEIAELAVSMIAWLCCRAVLAAVSMSLAEVSCCPIDQYAALSAAVDTASPVDTWFWVIFMSCCVMLRDCSADNAAELVKIEIHEVLPSD